MNDLPAIITAIATLIVALTAIVSVFFNNKKIKVVDKKVEVVDHKVDDVGTAVGEVHEEVKTANSQSIAQLADAVETRRIEKLSPKDRTNLEKSHLEDME